MKREANNHEESKRSKIHQEYFESYEDPEIHRLMITDRPRTEAYRNAILENKHLFEGKTCLDVGAGSGILSLFMAQAGAKVVHAVEASAMSWLIPKIAKANGFEDVITVHHCIVEDATIPRESVDIIVSEWMGFYLFHESMLASVLFARDQYLNSYGLIFPTEFKLYAAPCSLESFSNEKLNFWDDVYGFNMNSIKDYSNKLISGKPQITNVPPEELLGNPVLVKSFNISNCNNSHFNKISQACFTGITKSGNYRGLCLWFDCDFIPIVNQETKHSGTISTLSTSPLAPQTHWKQTVIVFDRSQNDTDVKYNSTGSTNKIIVGKCDTVDQTKQENHCNPEASCVKEDQPETKQAEDNQSDMPASSADDDISSTTVADNLEVDDSENYFLEEDEVVGWSIDLATNETNPRHYDIAVELVCALEETHPVPCSCPMMKCVLIAKLISMDSED